MTAKNGQGTPPGARIPLPGDGVPEKDKRMFFDLIREDKVETLDEFLQKNPAAARWMDPAHRPPLVAARTLGVSEVLLKHGADPNQATLLHGITAVSAHILSRSHSGQTVEDAALERLLDHGGRIDLAVQIRKNVIAPTAVELAHQYEDRNALGIFMKKAPEALAAATVAYAEKCRAREAEGALKDKFKRGVTQQQRPVERVSFGNVIKTATSKILSRP